MNDVLNELNISLPFQSRFAMESMVDLSTLALERLNERELRELESFQHLKRQREFVTSRLLLKKMAQEWSLPVDKFIIEKNNLGNPFARVDAEEYEVSIAHTTEAVFCGLSDNQPIGVDLEPTERTVSEQLRNRMMHPAEQQDVLDVSTVRLWTIKEAYIKLRGKGLRLNMNDVFVQPKDDYFVVKLNNDKKAKICSFEYQNNWLAIAFYL